MKYRFISLLIVLLVLSACSDKQEEVIEIKDKHFSGKLWVQKVENITSTEEQMKMTTNKQMIEQILSMVDGLAVKEMNNEKMLEKMKSQDSYFFSFAEGTKMEIAKPMPYAFIVLKDGTFIFTHKDVHSVTKPLVTIEKHPDLLEEMKQLVKVEF
ncbi:hypothetical protein [Bacillus massiliigorillae]|uniref:hypothetical protein n=1 Tax=Bacillus massiliigorillae TaxID=1243664 RepID=UPI0003A67941|nr:hypothetical protein [Bacillus massiliigorillae]